MRTIKPLKLGLLLRTFESAGRSYLVVTLPVCFPFDAPELVLPEVSLWKLVGEEMGDGAVLDEGMAKICGEVLVTGRAFTPGGVPHTGVALRLRMGKVDKTLYVVGDRTWGASGPSEPQPFVEMAVDWAHAFGGPGLPENPLGKGLVPVLDDSGRARLPLPNVEDPRRAMRSAKDRPPPVGFEAYDFAWPQRISRAGTYDQRWLEQDAPGLARDVDWRLFNAAPEDQWLDGHFNGEERFSIENMHPTEPMLEGRLPALVARCFITRRGGDPGLLEEVPTRIDTVRLFPRARKGVVFFRGVVAVREDDADDVGTLLAGLEARGEPKPFDHYQQVLEQRLDKDKGFLLALRDSDLMPPQCGSKHAADELNEDGALLETEGLMRQNLVRRVEKQLESIRQTLRDAGLDPDAHVPAALPEPAPPPELEEIPEFVEQAMADHEIAMAKVRAAVEQSEAQVRAQCAEAGLDYDALLEAQRAKQGGPIKFSADEEMTKLWDLFRMACNAGVPLPAVEALLTDPVHAQKLREAEQGFRDMYRRWAHVMPAARPLGPDEADPLRVQVVAALDAHESLAERDLTGARLDGLDFAGADLRGAMLEAASLAGADLSGADLTDAVLARANLTGATMCGAKLAGANLGGALLVGANVSGSADLSRAVLTGADLSRATFAAACMDGADLSEAIFQGTDLTGVRAENVNILSGKLRAVSLRKAHLKKWLLFDCELDGVDLTGATLEAVSLVTVRAPRAVLRGLIAPNLRAVVGCEFVGADLHGAKLAGSNLRGANLEGADLSEAELDKCDLSECNLQGANLHRASAKESLFVRTDLRGANLQGANLMQALLQKANIEGADLSGSNLFRADFARVRGNEATRFEEAHMKQIRFVRREDHG